MYCKTSTWRISRKHCNTRTQLCFAKFGLSRYSIVHSLRNRDAMIRHVITAIGMYISSPCFRSAVWGAFPKLRLWPLSSATLTLTTCGKKNQIKMWPIRVMKACVECFRTWNQINVNLMQLWNVLCAFVSSIPYHVSTDRQKTHKKKTFIRLKRLNSEKCSSKKKNVAAGGKKKNGKKNAAGDKDYKEESVEILAWYWHNSNVVASLFLSSLSSLQTYSSHPWNFLYLWFILSGISLPFCNSQKFSA